LPDSGPHIYTQIFGQDAISFQKLPDLVNRFLTAPDPVVLHYIINPGTPPPERPQAYDVEVKTEDTALKQKMTVTIGTSKESGQTVLKLDEEVIIHSLDLWVESADDPLFLDFSPRSITAQLLYEEDIPGVFCPRPGSVYPNVVGIPIKGSRKYSW
jgi:hypothetical protein